ncbi:MAG: hypothetical protein CM1200mP20_06000 [Pseudomonadota bacterium]|nr:MAG: hypothetical protein CM1200mP20_06000 [Pseudomonadota bacterium]
MLPRVPTVFDGEIDLESTGTTKTMSRGATNAKL